MNQTNIDYLEANMQHLINARDSYFKHLGGEVRLNFERIMSEEFRPGYKADIWCDHCALEMIKILDIHYRQWKDSQFMTVVEVGGSGGGKTVAANFPSHKNK